jgi:hypothetical protein
LTDPLETWPAAVNRSCWASWSCEISVPARLNANDRSSWMFSGVPAGNADSRANSFCWTPCAVASAFEMSTNTPDRSAARLSDPLPDALPDPLPLAEPDALPELLPLADPDEDPDALPDVEPEALPEPDPDALPEPDPDALPDALPDVLPLQDEEPEVEPEVDPEVEPDMLPLPEAEPEVEPEVDPDALPLPVTRFTSCASAEVSVATSLWITVGFAPSATCWETSAVS